jgi:MOSC domain-containing protein YiiM
MKSLGVIVSEGNLSHPAVWIGSEVSTMNMENAGKNPGARPEGAKVVAINISTRKGVPKTTIPEGEFIVDFGLKGDAHGGNWHRQVSFLGVESIAKVRMPGTQGLGTGKFAENITTEGIELFTLSIGTRLQIGEAAFQITQIGKECHQKCAIFHQVGDCVMPREGIFAKVIQGGIVRPGDPIIVLAE